MVLVLLVWVGNMIIYYYRVGEVISRLGKFDTACITLYGYVMAAEFFSAEYLAAHCLAIDA